MLIPGLHYTTKHYYNFLAAKFKYADEEWYVLQIATRIAIACYTAKFIVKIVKHTTCNCGPAIKFSTLHRCQGISLWPLGTGAYTGSNMRCPFSLQGKSVDLQNEWMTEWL